MKTIISFCLTLFFSLNIISQETIAIPDIGLEECLIDLGIDSNGLNGSILVDDAKHVVNLNINDPIKNKLLPNVHSKVKDLTGLESFPNLKRIDCFGNEITKIDLSKSTSITFLNCSENNIESLDLSNNTKLVYVSCDNNRISKLTLGANNRLESLYCSFNNLTTIDVTGCDKLESFDTTGNKLGDIIVTKNQFDNIPEGWYKDQDAIYTTVPTRKSSNEGASSVIMKKQTNTVTKPVATKTVVKSETKVQSNSTENTSNYYEKFQSSVIAEYDKLVLNDNHLQSKKIELQQKYSVNLEQFTQWINTYSNLTNKNGSKNTFVGSARKNTNAFYTKFKKSAVKEYEKAVLNAAYLQSKKEEIIKKHNLDAKQFNEWINLLGNPSLKITTEKPADTENQYTKFKISLVKEYDHLVLNQIHLQKQKSFLQKKYNLTATQLNQWIKKYSKVNTL